MRPVALEHRAPPVRHDVPLVARLLHYVAVTLWGIPTFVLIGWLFGWGMIAPSERHSIIVGSALFYGLGLLIGWIGEWRGAGDGICVSSQFAAAVRLHSAGNCRHHAGGLHGFRAGATTVYGNLGRAGRLVVSEPRLLCAAIPILRVEAPTPAAVLPAAAVAAILDGRAEC